jgi:hypothetical protein
MGTSFDGTLAIADHGDDPDLRDRDLLIYGRKKANQSPRPVLAGESVSLKV